MGHLHEAAKEHRRHRPFRSTGNSVTLRSVTKSTLASICFCAGLLPSLAFVSSHPRWPLPCPGSERRLPFVSISRSRRDVSFVIRGGDAHIQASAVTSEQSEQDRDPSEICFDPQSFERPDPCIPDPSSNEDSCLPPNPVLSEDKNEIINDDDDDEVCIVAYESPALPRYELPMFDDQSKERYRQVGDNDDLAGLDGKAKEDEEEKDNNTAHGSYGNGASDPDDYKQNDDNDQIEHHRALNGRGIVIIDNFSPYHGNYISRMALEAYGAGVVSALSNYVTGYLYQEKGMTEHLPSRLPDLDDLEDVERWASSIPFEIVGIICESDSGLDDAERLGEALGLFPDRNDGCNPARRDKFLMNEECQRHGLRVVRQKMCQSLDEALEFARELGVCEKEGDASAGLDCDNYSAESANDEVETQLSQDDGVMDAILSEMLDGEDESIPSNDGILGLATNDHEPSGSSTGRYCVVKPTRGVASDDVHLCPDFNSVRTAFSRIKGSTVFGSMHGQKHDSVLLQEFAVGTEYAIDVVSKAGHHKVAAIWRYDKRPANGAAFVYHATELVDADTAVGRAISEYCMSALDALNVHWGISHNELIVDEDGPRLVEVNLRQHNTDFAPLCSACIGYNALDMLLAAYLGDAEEFPPNTEHKRLMWDEVPDLPVTRAYGAIVHLVSHKEGTLSGINVPALEEIEAMPSVLAMELYPQYSTIGEHIERTIDIRTDSGWLHLMNDNSQEFKSDYDRVVELMPHMFSVKEEEGAGGGRTEL